MLTAYTNYLLQRKLIIRIGQENHNPEAVPFPIKLKLIRTITNGVLVNQK